MTTPEHNSVGGRNSGPPHFYSIAELQNRRAAYLNKHSQLAALFDNADYPYDGDRPSYVSKSDWEILQRASVEGNLMWGRVQRLFDPKRDCDPITRDYVKNAIALLKRGDAMWAEANDFNNPEHPSYQTRDANFQEWDRRYDQTAMASRRLFDYFLQFVPSKDRLFLKIERRQWTPYPFFVYTSVPEILGVSERAFKKMLMYNYIDVMVEAINPDVD